MIDTGGRRLLNLEQAAKYLGMSRDSFDRRKAVMPSPVYPFGPESDARWDVLDLDRWVDALKGPRAEAEAVAAALLRGENAPRAGKRGRRACSDRASRLSRGESESAGCEDRLPPA